MAQRSEGKGGDLSSNSGTHINNRRRKPSPLASMCTEGMHTHVGEIKTEEEGAWWGPEGDGPLHGGSLTSQMQMV